MRERVRRPGLCWRILGALWLIGVAPTSAQELSLRVEIGKTVERSVGYARGWTCDDPSLVTAELVTRDDHNVWIVTGKKLGSTQCRVGTDPYGVAYVFDVRVVARTGAERPRGRGR